ncbi:hypothetical protein NTGZN8_10006 [Candidatus Nitrotoga fabula]|uniref:Uncharacterized protein n=1 Tax=Candidatus Nitrotoga fabula TaxID=2182327 RepID=A0A916FA21_9PROT|nr:hypothetical protein NTGZN8_10006 [Candidatus Nitrotoga fabula]
MGGFVSTPGNRKLPPEPVARNDRGGVSIIPIAEMMIGQIICYKSGQITCSLYDF